MKDRSYWLTVITITAVGVVLYLAIAITGFERAKGDELPQAPRLTRPQLCSEFAVEYEPEQWNEVTESYPTNHAWESCMGVSSK